MVCCWLTPGVISLAVPCWCTRCCCGPSCGYRRRLLIVEEANFKETFRGTPVLSKNYEIKLCYDAVLGIAFRSGII